MNAGSPQPSWMEGLSQGQAEHCNLFGLCFILVANKNLVKYRLFEVGLVSPDCFLGGKKKKKKKLKNKTIKEKEAHLKMWNYFV